MIENLHRTPLSFGMACKVIRCHAVNRFSNCVAKRLEGGIHCCFSRMSPDTRGRKFSFHERASMKRLALVLMSLAVVSGCTSGSNPSEEAKPKPPELLT